MKRFLRGVAILWVVFRYGLDGLVLDSFNKPWLRMISRILSVGRNLDAPRGQRLREALERLGPIFVKFGQVLSTRRDLLPADIADELARLQDRVPPFDPDVAMATIERAFRRPVDEVFTSFDRTPVASASIAQVHFATLRDRQGVEREVAVKVLRPGMLPVIEKDLSLMRMMAGWVENLSADGKRLKPREVVAEFDNYLHRRANVPGWEVGSSMLFLMFCEFYYLLLWATIGVLRQWNHFPEVFHAIPWIALGSAVVFVLVHLFFGGRIGAGLAVRERPIFRAFRMAKVRHYAAVIALRSPALLAAVVVYAMALRLFGVTVAMTEMLGYLPVIFFGAATPGPMHSVAIVLWVVLFPGRLGTMTTFGFVQHNFFILFNAAVGLLFLRRATRELLARER